MEITITVEEFKPSRFRASVTAHRGGAFVSGVVRAPFETREAAEAWANSKVRRAN